MGHRFRASLLVTCVAAVALSGCASYGTPQQQASATCHVLGPSAALGAIAGAAGGAMVGGLGGGDERTALIGAGIGLIAGVVAGIAKDRADCKQALAALTEVGSGNDGQTSSWQSGDQSISLVATGGYFQRGTETCRRFERTSTGPNGSETGIGVTCRTSGGDYYVAVPPTADGTG